MKAYIALVLAIAAPVFAEELQARGGGGGGGEGGGYGGGGKPTATWGQGGGGGGGYSTTTDVVYTTSMHFHFMFSQPRWRLVQVPTCSRAKDSLPYLHFHTSSASLQFVRYYVSWNQACCYY